ncbi:MAG: right-handed parallel beta-helix repeat-containing protein, partial [Actinomycetota bacterium]
MVGAAVIVSSTAARPADDRIDGSAVAASRAERRIEPVSAGGPTPALPDIAPGTFVFDPAAWGVPTNGTDRVATTNGFQAAIDHAVGLGLGTFEVPAGTYLIGVERNAEYTGGIELPDRFALVLDDGAVLRQAIHDRWNSCVVGVTRSTDVVIRGGTIIGDRDTHVFTPRPSDGAVDHDEGHLICIWTGAERVLVEAVRLADATGDGILLVGQTGPGSFVSDITIRRGEFDRNRRQGISIVGGVRVLIEDNEIHHTGGIAPQFGINVESLIYRSQNTIGAS